MTVHVRFRISFPSVLPVMLIFFMSVDMLMAQSSENPPGEGFNIEESDPKAIEIADKVMQALGGREAWDNTRYITWKFFGRRLHVWDKWTGRLRFEENDLTVLMNIQTQKGRAWVGEDQITAPASVQKKLQDAYEAWVNDSYWMFMPYKLKDSGVTLKYKGEGKTKDGQPAYILQLTFEEVGVTPQNKYLVYVNKESYLVTQWSYFPKATDEEPRFTLAWDNWQQFGNILLSDKRGEKNQHTDIAVFENLPDSVFESPEPVDMKAFME